MKTGLTLPFIHYREFQLRVFKHLPALLLISFSSASCFAADTVNISLVVDPSISCSQPIIDFAVSPQSTLGISPGSCNSNRPSGQSGTNANITNQFNRVAFNWRYAFNGVFQDGFYVGAGAGIENDSFSSTAGSTANVYFAAGALLTGYQWFWENGFNVTWNFSAAHLTRASLDNYKIAPAETTDVINWIDTNTSSNTHYSQGIFLGWAF